jgi:hypothetical protein
MANPYEAPRTETKQGEPEAAAAHSGFLGEIVIVMFGVVFARAMFDLMGQHFIAAYSPAMMGLAVGVVCARAASRDPNGGWMAKAIGLCVLGFAALLIGPLVLHMDKSLIAPWPHVYGLVIAAGRVGAALRVVRMRENQLLRDDDMRAHFAEQERRERAAPPRAKSTAPLRMACSSCGELTSEGELTIANGERLCAACAPA